MTRACKNCQWWLAEAGRSGGECRGAPPTPVATLDGPDAIWPRTGAFMWCGAFRTAERLAGGITDADFEDAHRRMGERIEALAAKKETKQ